MAAYKSAAAVTIDEYFTSGEVDAFCEHQFLNISFGTIFFACASLVPVVRFSSRFLLAADPISFQF